MGLLNRKGRTGGIEATITAQAVRRESPLRLARGSPDRYSPAAVEGR
jgi:hypothetical protein